MNYIHKNVHTPSSNDELATAIKRDVKHTDFAQSLLCCLTVYRKIYSP